MRRLGVYGENLPTKKERSVEAADFSIAGLVGYFDRKYNKPFRVTSDVEARTLFGEQTDRNSYGWDALNGFFANLRGTGASVYIYSPVGEGAQQAQKALAGLLVKASYQGTDEYGEWANRTGFSVKTGAYYTSPILSKDEKTYGLESVANLRVGDLVRVYNADKVDEALVNESREAYEQATAEYERVSKGTQQTLSEYREAKQDADDAERAYEQSVADREHAEEAIADYPDRIQELTEELTPIQTQETTAKTAYDAAKLLLEQYEQYRESFARLPAMQEEILSYEPQVVTVGVKTAITNLRRDFNSWITDATVLALITAINTAISATTQPADYDVLVELAHVVSPYYDYVQALTKAKAAINTMYITPETAVITNFQTMKTATTTPSIVAVQVTDFKDILIKKVGSAGTISATSFHDIIYDQEVWEKYLDLRDAMVAAGGASVAEMNFKTWWGYVETQVWTNYQKMVQFEANTRDSEAEKREAYQTLYDQAQTLRNQISQLEDTLEYSQKNIERLKQDEEDKEEALSEAKQTLEGKQQEYDEAEQLLADAQESYDDARDRYERAMQEAGIWTSRVSKISERDRSVTLEDELFGDTLEGWGFKLTVYRKSLTGVVSQVYESDWLTDNSQDSDRYAPLAFADNEFVSVQVTAAVQDCDVCYLEGGWGGSVKDVDYHAFDNLPIRMVAYVESANEDAQSALEAYCRARKDNPIVVLTPQMEVATKTRAVQIGNNFQRSDEVDALLVLNWLGVSDPFAQSPLAPDRLVPPAGHIMGLWIYVMGYYGIHSSVARVTAPIIGVNSVAGYTAESDIDRTELAEAGVNVVQKIAGKGVLLRNSFTPSTAKEFRYANAVIQRNFIKVSCVDSLAESENVPNTIASVREDRMAVLQFMNKLWRQGSTGDVKEGETFGQYERADGSTSTTEEAFEVVADATNNSVATLQAGERNIDVWFMFPAPAGSIKVGVGLIYKTVG